MPSYVLWLVLCSGENVYTRLQSNLSCVLHTIIYFCSFFIALGTYKHRMENTVMKDTVPVESSFKISHVYSSWKTLADIYIDSTHFHTLVLGVIFSFRLI